MNKITHSLFLASLLASSLIASDLDASLSQDHTYEKQAQANQAMSIGDWKIFGDVRVGWLEYDYNNDPKNPEATINQGHKDSKGIYIIPKLSIQSPYYNGLMFKATIAGATDFGINDELYESRNFVFDSTDLESFVILQEGFLFYENGKNKVLVGREELTTPMVDADDWYMLANSFELARYQNKSLQDTTINLGYFHKMAGVWDSAANGTEFHSMADASYVDSRDKESAQGGLAFASYTYNDNKNHQLQVWDYYGFDLYNILFVQYDYTNKVSDFSYDAGIQVINFKEVDGNKYTNIDYTLYQARFDGEFNNGFNFATGIAKCTDGEGQGATLGAFGGYPYFANGMIFHFFEAGSLQNAASYKGQVGYDLGKLGVKDTWIGYRYTFFDLDGEYSKNKNGLSQDGMRLNGIRISYGGDFGSYFTGTYEHVGLDNEPNTYSLRLIGGYKF